jgi:hypothetical protein
MVEAAITEMERWLLETCGMLSLRLVAAVVAVSAVVASPAFAQTPGSDTNAPEGGGIPRGVSAAAPATPPPSDRLRVHMTGSPDASLETRSGEGWALVCTSPCDQWLPIGGNYRVTGPDIRDSTAFALEGKTGTTDSLYVDAASSSAFAGGMVAASIGYAATAIGLALVLVAAMENLGPALDADGSGNFSSPPSGIGLAVPAGMIISGAVVGTIGLVLNRSNVHTSVDQTPKGDDCAPPSPVSVRTPTWRDTPTPARDLAAAPIVVPLYALTF